jgi:hypothetical protein
MSYQLYDQLSGPICDYVPANAGLMRTYKYGIKANVAFTAEGRYKSEDFRRGAVFTNVLSPIGIGIGKLVDDPSCYDGWNSRLLDDYAAPLEKACIDLLKSTARFRLDTAVNWGSVLGNNQPENCVSVLYNLLRLWIYKSSSVEQYKVGNDYEYYDDGHVQIRLRDYLGIDIADRQGITFEDIPPVIRLSETPDIEKDIFLPNLENLTTKEVSILAIALSKFSSNCTQKILHESPALATFIAQLPNSRHGHIDLQVVEFSAHEVMQTLRKYVYSNRLESQFDLAYFMVINGLFNPMARAAEANAWINPIQEVYMPVVSTRRGLFKEILEGTPYEAYAERRLTWENFLKYPTRIYLHAAAVCEALYCGIFEIATAGGGNISDNLAMLGVTGSSVTQPYRLFIEAASYRFGNNIEVLWSTNAGYDHALHLYGDRVNQRDIIVSKADLDDNQYTFFESEVYGQRVIKMVAREVKPALFPCLSMAVNDKRFYLNELKYSATMGFNARKGCLVTTDARTVNKMLSILRVSGHDAVAFSSAEQRYYKNWAANSNGQVMPVFKPSDYEDDLYTINVGSIVARKRNWLHIPAITDKLALSVNIDIIDYVAFINGELQTRYVARYIPIRKPVGKLIDGDKTLVVVKTTPEKLAYNYTDFQLTTAADIPVVSQLVSEDTQTSQSIDQSVETDGVDNETTEALEI